MSRSETPQAWIRVERGAAGAEELAALTAVLAALCGRAPRPGPARAPAACGWWRGAGGYRSPESWQ
jgi:hypothetical protein